jgi:hypothetical protein
MKLRVKFKKFLNKKLNIKLGTDEIASEIQKILE